MAPTEEEIQRMLADAAAQTERNSGGEEIAARRTLLRERSRRMARRSVQFNIAAGIAWLVLAAFLMLLFHLGFNAG